MEFTLTPDQQTAADGFLSFMLDKSQRELVIGGFAGTGKSTLTRYILDAVYKQMKLVNLINMGNADHELPTHVTATTNKAAQVVADMLGSEPQTIHSFLGLNVTYDSDTGRTQLRKTKRFQIIDRCLVIIDEASFIDSRLLGYIREACVNCKVLFIGDPFQLALPGEIIPPVFNSSIPDFQLTQVMRNEGVIESTSAMYREAVKTGCFEQLILTQGNIEHVDGSTFQKLINSEFTNMDRDPDSSKILAWRNNRVHEYNDYVRHDLHGLGKELSKGELVLTNKPVTSGKKAVMQTDEVSRVRSVGSTYQDADGIWGRMVKLENGVDVFQPDSQDSVRALLRKHASTKNWFSYYQVKEEYGDLRPLHACTVHKSQGSTYRTVFVDLSDIGRNNIPSDVARMLYVAVSRASEKVYLYGDLPEKYGGTPCYVNSPPTTAMTLPATA